MGRSYFACVVVLGCMIYASLPSRWAFAQPASIEEVGWLDDDNRQSDGYGISGDGSVIVGGSIPAGDYPKAFRWTPAGDTENLGTLGDVVGSSVARGISSDGNVIVGESEAPNGNLRAFRWTTSGGMQNLGTSADEESHAYGASEDGAVIVGGHWLPTLVYHAFRWSGGELEDLGSLEGPDSGYSIAYGVSADGSVVVGYSSAPGSVNRAFRWTQAEGMEDLGSLAGSEGASYALGVSVDGNVIVGESQAPGGVTRPFRWTEAEGMQELPLVADSNAVGIAHCCSADGSVIFGKSGSAACLWIDGQPRSLRNLLAGYGADPVEAGWRRLDVVTGCSADGTTVTGNGIWDADAAGLAFRATLFIDRVPPQIVPSGQVREFCDAGKTFATIDLTAPQATDDAPGEIVLTNDAGRRFPIGKTQVVWTATDVAGNQSQWTQAVIVVNRKPRANAGKDVTVTTTSERGVRVRLDGRKSSDPDDHRLTFGWSAPGVTLTPAKSATPSAIFPVGAKNVRLTVTDAGGAKDSDTVRVTVKLKNARRRPRGAQANEAFAAAADRISASIASGSSGAEASQASLYLQAADVLGDATGEFVRWEDGGSEEDAEVFYARQRTLQRTYGEAATLALVDAYVESGDENLLLAAELAAWGTAFADADLLNR